MKKNREDQEFESEEESWDFKKILLGMTFFSLVVSFFLYVGYKKLQSQDTVLGIASQREKIKEERDALVGSAKGDAAVVIDQVKEDVSKLSAENLGTSSEQIQKIINNLKMLQDIKDDSPFDTACKFVCKK